MDNYRNEKNNWYQMSDNHLRCEEVQKLMEETPPLMQRIGITVIFVIVIVLLIICAFVRYPKKVLNGKIIYSNQTILEKIIKR